MDHRVRVERHVEQVVDGYHYKGYVKFEDRKFEYELKFGVPIDKLDTVDLKTEEDLRRTFQITLKRDGAEVKLTTKEELGFFIHLLAELAISFFENPQTRDNNQGPLGDLVRGEGRAAAFGMTMSIGMTGTTELNLPRELANMLRAPKFGCTFRAA